MVDRRTRRAALLAPLILATAPVAAQQTVVIGSKNFTESNVLGEIMRLVIEDRTDLVVEHRAGLGGTLVCFSALEAGEIDLYAEYTGTAWSVLLGETERAPEPLATYLHTQRRLRAQHGLELIAPFGLDNTYVLAVSNEAAERLELRTISDLAARGAELRAGFSIEFTDRADGWPGLRDAYGLALADVRAMEHGLAYEAVAAGEIDVVDAYATDGKLLRFPLTLLEDDRGFFPPYHAAPLVRRETLALHPDLRTALEELAYRLDDRTMQQLNYAVEVEGRTFEAAAAEFLVDAGLGVRSAEGLSEVGRTGPRRGERGVLGTLADRWKETLGLVLEHLGLTLTAVVLAVLAALPLGIWASRSPAVERVVLGFTGVIQTIPSLALLASFIAIEGLGLSARSAIVALFLYALLPIVRNTATGLRDVAPDVVDAAVGMGLTERQVLWRVRMPLAVRTILAGVRTATVISIGVATLAAFIGAGGLGEPIVTGLYLNDPDLVLSGALPAAALALLCDYGLARVENAVTPRGLRGRQVTSP